MTKLKDVRLLDVLPDSIASDPSMAAIAYAIQPLLTETIENANAGDLWARVNELTSGQLDHLAWQYDSAVWRDSWPLSLKRQVILGVLLEKTKRGTVWAIKQAVSALGSAVDVKTWFEMDPMGQPGTFDVQISVGQVPGQSSADSQRDLRAAIDEAKAFRSHYTLTLAEQFESAVGLYGAARPMVYVKLRAEGEESEPVPSVRPLTLTFENRARFYWDSSALSSVEVDWGDGAGYEAQDVQAGSASITYGDNDPKTVRVLIEANEGKHAEICPDCRYATAFVDFGTQIVGMGDLNAGWFPQEAAFKITITSWPNELPSQLTRANALFAFATFTEAPDWDYSNVVNGYGMLAYCNNLTSFTGDLSSLVVGDLMFGGCVSLTAVNITMTGALEQADQMFGGCMSFNQDISDWCVPLIPSKPAGFDAGAGFANQPELQPQWGEPC